MQKLLQLIPQLISPWTLQRWKNKSTAGASDQHEDLKTHTLHTLHNSNFSLVFVGVAVISVHSIYCTLLINSMRMNFTLFSRNFVEISLKVFHTSCKILAHDSNNTFIPKKFQSSDISNKRKFVRAKFRLTEDVFLHKCRCEPCSTSIRVWKKKKLIIQPCSLGSTYIYLPGMDFCLRNVRQHFPDRSPRPGQ